MSYLSDEDATRMLATCPQQVLRVGLVEFGERHDTDKRAALHRNRLPVDQSGKRVVSCPGKSPDTPDILARILARISGVSRGCHEDAMRKVLL